MEVVHCAVTVFPSKGHKRQPNGFKCVTVILAACQGALSMASCTQETSVRYTISSVQHVFYKRRKRAAAQL